jgi:hypothetical protein
MVSNKLHIKAKVLIILKNIFAGKYNPKWCNKVITVRMK